MYIIDKWTILVPRGHYHYETSTFIPIDDEENPIITKTDYILATEEVLTSYFFPNILSEAIEYIEDLPISLSRFRDT